MGLSELGLLKLDVVFGASCNYGLNLGHYDSWVAGMSNFVLDHVIQLFQRRGSDSWAVEEWRSHALAEPVT